MSDHWDFYFFVVDGKPCSTMLDLGLVNDAPITGKSWLLSVRLPLARPRPDGLTDNPEAEELAKVEEALLRSLSKRCGAQFVGRMTWNGTRDLFFYAANPEGMQEAVGEALGPKPSRRVLTLSKQDPEWQHYLEVLYPDELERLWMRDRRVVEELRRVGDRLDHPRVVDHVALFPNEAGAVAFGQACQALRFEVVSRPLDDHSGWQVEVSRTDTVELAHIHEVSSSLFLLAQEHAGTYDGWGAPVVKGTDA